MLVDRVWKRLCAGDHQESERSPLGNAQIPEPAHMKIPIRSVVESLKISTPMETYYIAPDAPMLARQGRITRDEKWNIL